MDREAASQASDWGRLSFSPEPTDGNRKDRKRPAALPLRKPETEGRLRDPYAAAIEPPRQVPVLQLVQHSAAEDILPGRSQAPGKKPAALPRALQGINTEGLALMASLNKLERQPEAATQIQATPRNDTAPGTDSGIVILGEQADAQSASQDEDLLPPESGPAEAPKSLTARMVLDKWEQKKDKLRRKFSQQVHERAHSIQRDPHEVVMGIMKRIVASDDQTYTYEPRGESAGSRDSLSVSDLMSGGNLACVYETITVEQLAGVFNRLQLSVLPVIDSQSRGFLGLISKDDLFSHAFSERLLSSLHLGASESECLSLLQLPAIDFMDPQQTVQVEPECPVEAACELMIRQRVNHLAVTREGEILGIFSSFDALGLVERQAQRTGTHDRHIQSRRKPGKKGKAA